MPAQVHIPTALRRFTGELSTVEVEGRTISEVLELLGTTYSQIRTHLFTEDGHLRNFVNVYLNDEDIRYLNKEMTAVSDGDVIIIVPAVAGGGELGS